MANGSVANGKAKSPTPATNPIGEYFQPAQESKTLFQPNTYLYVIYVSTDTCYKILLTLAFNIYRLDALILAPKTLLPPKHGKSMFNEKFLNLSFQPKFQLTSHRRLVPPTVPSQAK